MQRFIKEKIDFDKKKLFETYQRCKAAKILQNKNQVKTCYFVYLYLLKFYYISMKQWNKNLHIEHMEKERILSKSIGEEKISPEWNLVDIWNSFFVLLVIIVPKTKYMLFLLYFKSKIYIPFISSAKLLEAIRGEIQFSIIFTFR